MTDEINLSSEQHISKNITVAPGIVLRFENGAYIMPCKPNEDNTEVMRACISYLLGQKQTDDLSSESEFHD